MLQQPIGIIDIGSNSVRLVIYAGATRAPFVIFNEKIMAGLGKTLPDSGALSDQAQERALAALRRFAALVRQMNITRTRVVATAAVRDAPNGGVFLGKVHALGFQPEMLSGESEGVMAGQGVLSAIPEADGIVGDLGGGSLELVDVADGKIIHSVTLPFGTLQTGALVKKGGNVFQKKFAKMLDSSGFRQRGKGRRFYMVGGSWRALARFDMQMTSYPLPIIHHYRMDAGRPAELQKAMQNFDKANPKGFSLLSASRLSSLPGANFLLKALVDELDPGDLVVSAYGIREGLLYDKLSMRVKTLDPLLEAAREAGEKFGRFPDHGDLLDAWMAPIFDDNPRQVRIRRAACLLSDVAWQAHPDFRAERGLDMALHGNWVGIDIPGRVMLGQALFYSFGGGRKFSDTEIARLCPAADLHRASLWGLAMRLGHRFSGGVATSLSRSRLRINGDTLCLEMRKADAILYGELVERRLQALADAFGLKAEAVVR